MKKWLLIALLVVGVVAAGGIYGLYWMMSQSLYQIGNVSKEVNLRGSLDPPKQSNPETWQVESDIELAFQSYGEGRPVLVVHGGPGIPYDKQWKGLEGLNDQFKFYFYHQRGCGNSTRPIDKMGDNGFYQNMLELDKTLGLGAQIADIERIRKILGEEKLLLIGHSYGGFIATLYAAEFPEKVEKLVLVAPAGVLTPMTEERDFFTNAKSKLPESDHVAYDRANKEYMDFSDIFSKTDDQLVQRHQSMGGYLLKAMGYKPENFQSDIKPGGWAVYAMFFSSGMSPNYSPALSMIKAPTLIIHGANDDLALAGSKSYQPIKDSKFVMIEKEGTHSGHFVFDDCPDLFLEQISAFLK